MSETRMIRKYPNRRLYDTEESRYVDLAGIQEMVASGVNLVVIEKKSGEDITRSVLLQVIAAQEQRGESLLSHEFLLQVIRSQEEGSPSVTASYLEQSLNFIGPGVRSTERGKANQHSAEMAQRLAQKHYRCWHSVEDEIYSKLTN